MRIETRLLYCIELYGNTWGMFSISLELMSLLKGLCDELRGYSVITHLALKIRSSVKKTLS